MKVTLWQQFSSNHSGHFNIVGVFDTPDAAKKAADEIQQIIETIQNWHKNNPEKADALYARWASGDEYPAPLSEIEETLAKKYDVRWPNGIDWFDDAQIEIIREHIVQIDTKYQVDWGPQPFDQIIEQMGGYGLVTGMDIGGERYGHIWVALSCIAPDEETAIKLEQSKTTKQDDYDEITQTVRRNDSRLVFGWEWYEGIWQLDKLISELEKLGCTEISYQFTGRKYTYTTKYHVPPSQES